MTRIANLRTWLLGLLIIGLSNAIVLGGVAYNRSAESTSELVLTERELGLASRYGFAAENSGISLRLQWRVFDSEKSSAYYSRWYPTDWLDAGKLASLGFDVSYPLDQSDSYERYQKTLSREVFVVLEYDGPIFQRVLQQRQQEVEEAKALQLQIPDKQEFATRLEKAMLNLKAEQNSYSRLFAIDAGLDYTSLRQQYSDQHKYLIARGRINLIYQHYHDQEPYLSGVIQSLSVGEVNVPMQYAGVLQPYLDEPQKRNGNQPPRYAVRLKYGQRYEPWVESVERL